MKISVLLWYMNGLARPEQTEDGKSKQTVLYHHLFTKQFSEHGKNKNWCLS